MKSGMCPKCGSRDVRITPGEPISLSYSRVELVPLLKYVCLQCGFVEEYVAHPDRDRARLATGDLACRAGGAVPLSDEVMRLARDPTTRDQAIAVYSQQAGVGREEATKAVEAYLAFGK